MNVTVCDVCSCSIIYHRATRSVNLKLDTDGPILMYKLTLCICCVIDWDTGRNSPSDRDPAYKRALRIRGVARRLAELNPAGVYIIGDLDFSNQNAVVFSR